METDEEFAMTSATLVAPEQQRTKADSNLPAQQKLSEGVKVIDRGKHNVLGVRINALNYDAAVDHIFDAAYRGEATAVSALAVHGLMTGVLDRSHRYRLNQFELLVPDGQPVRWALNLIHKTGLEDRVYGPTLMLKICEKAAEEGAPIFLFGGSDALLSDLAEQLITKFPKLKIAGRRASKFRTLDPSERQELAEEIKSSGAKIAFVGLGCPRQEVFAHEMKELAAMPLIAVGAAFNFHAGQLSQAPSWMQSRGLEWMYRLTREPRRLWRRYLLLNPLYLTLFALQWLGVYSLDPEAATEPKTEISYG